MGYLCPTGAVSPAPLITKRVPDLFIKHLLGYENTGISRGREVSVDVFMLCMRGNRLMAAVGFMSTRSLLKTSRGQA